MNYERPWEHEPDSEEFEHAGLLCAIRRGPAGTLNGYVAIPPSHPLHGKGYDCMVKPLPGALEDRPPTSYGAIDLFCAAALSDDISESCRLSLAIAVHGRLTFARGPTNWLPALPDAWWFGFDTAHAGDVCPKYSSRYGAHIEGDVYRTIEYVREQVRGLAEQLVKYAG